MNKPIERFKHHAGRAVRHRHVRRAVNVFHISMAIIGGLAFVSMMVQIWYPADRALPFAKIDTTEVGGLTRSEIEQKLGTAAGDAELTIKTPQKTYETKWASIGITIDRSATARAAVSYSLWERLIPFSLLVRGAQTAEIAPIAVVNKERLRAFAEKVAAENKQPATEAEIAIKNGEVTLQNSKGGFAFTVEDIERQLQSTRFHTGEQLTLQPRIIEATITHDELVTTKVRAEQIIDRELVLVVADREFTPPADVRGEWLQVAKDPLSHRIVVQLKRDALESYLNEIGAQVAKPAGVTEITLLNGQEVARIEGAPGKHIDLESAIRNIEKALFNATSGTKLNLALQDQPPKITYKRTYSQSDAGLTALIRDWEAETYGTYGIIVREIGGQHRYAEFQPDYSFVTASTFKMFIAYAIFTKMERGEISNSTILDNGWSVNACMNEMILHSTNPCATAFQNWLGQQIAEDMVHAAGFLDTHLNNQAGGDKYSTVRDETNFMLRLQSGTLLNDEHTARLLSLFKRQVWRGGIPAGVPRGVVVANKVGFYKGYVHDVGIVYGKKTTYILGVMSRGGSDPVFADLSRRVYNFMNR